MLILRFYLKTYLTEVIAATAVGKSAAAAVAALALSDKYKTAPATAATEPENKTISLTKK